ncbi:MAG TPA: hypothetical protein VG672_06490 [Bryobacteraceae bacterium]|nr:hypothetical protein [Bryobacteraceae bacterium]
MAQKSRSSKIVPPPAPEFIFRGNAVAAGGFLTKLEGKPIPFEESNITTHGESSLPVIGGTSHTAVEAPPLRFPNFIQYTNCETSVSATTQRDVAVTTLRASAQKVRLTTSPSPEDRAPKIRSISFVADNLSISARSIHPQVGQAQFELVGLPDTSGMSLILTPFEGETSVVPLRLEYDEKLLSFRTLQDVEKAFRSDQKFFDDLCPRLPGGESLVFKKSRLPRTPHGYVVCSIVRRIYRGGKAINGHVLVERGFGKIFFGVTILDGYSRRITLVRAKMGSDPGGDICFTGIDTNGIWN